MRFDDFEINSVSELLNVMRGQFDQTSRIWFRGQSNALWDLVPSLSRTERLLSNEMNLVKRFIQLAIPQMVERIPSASEEWDWVFLMQHHNLPTRLLDWSESPLASLWFAVQAEKYNAVDAALWCLEPLALNTQARLRGRWVDELPAFGRDDILDNYLPDKQKDGVGGSPVAAIASRHFKRIVAQQGNFTISHATSDPVNKVGDGTHIWRYKIPAASKENIRRELAYLRFNELQLFPDLDRAATVALGSF